MAKTIATLVGVVFILVGIVGFVAPEFLGTHLSMVHNIVHLVSGAVSLYLGTKGTLAQARLFCIVFGIVYGLLGVAGFLLGKPATPTIAGMADMGQDPRLFQVIPGQLELGQMDHIVHILIGVLYLVGGFLTKAAVERATAD